MTSTPLKESLKYLKSFSLLVIVFFALPALADEPDDHGRGPIKVLTQNLYVGADILRVVDVGSVEDIPGAVAQTLQIIQQTNFPERAKAIAKEIKRAQPDLIGLQEVSTLRTQFPGDFFVGNPQQAEDVMYDYLDILLAELKKKGLHYKVAAIVQNADVEVPAYAGTDGMGNPLFMDVRLTDHDVILARKSIKIRNSTAKHYFTNLQVPVTENFTIDFTRGYTAVDARVRGKWYRFANTHLELPGPPPVSLIPAAQAQELIGVLSQSPLPVVLVGDFNSSPEDQTDSTGAVPPYMQLVMSNFADTWLHRFGKPSAGYTCCQDELLDNETSLLNMRIDHIFVRSPDGDPTVLNDAMVLANTVGDRPKDKTPSGLWPSDHAGVWARIKFFNPRELHREKWRR
ncbi:MAG: endonuclease/exonuclease/phosphatase family protein [Gammaproteobacteria bacterium]|jgi:endonuclease/exonuclease/phosphatase family metal-dependent hydrolase